MRKGPHLASCHSNSRNYSLTPAQLPRIWLAVIIVCLHSHVIHLQANLSQICNSRKRHWRCPKLQRDGDLQAENQCHKYPFQRPLRVLSCAITKIKTDVAIYPKPHQEYTTFLFCRALIALKKSVLVCKKALSQHFPCFFTCTDKNSISGFERCYVLCRCMSSNVKCCLM